MFGEQGSNDGLNCLRFENVNGHSRVAGCYIWLESLKWTRLNIFLINVSRHSRVAGHYIEKICVESLKWTRLVDVSWQL